MNSGRTPEAYRAFFAEVFAELDARPRRTGVRFMADALTIDIVDGNPVFILPGQPPAEADFRRRWLAEHPVPLVLSGRRAHVLRLVPTTGNRVKVRSAFGLARFWYNIRSMRFSAFLCVLVAIGTARAAPVTAFRAFDTLQEAMSADLVRLSGGAVPGRSPSWPVSVTVRPALPGEYAGPWIVDVKSESPVTTTLIGPDGHPIQPSGASRFLVENPRLWTTEKPICYQLVVADGSEFLATVLAFRETEVREGCFLLNGVPIDLKAEQSPFTWAPSVVREANCNAVIADRVGDAFSFKCEANGILVLKGDEPGIRRRSLGAEPRIGFRDEVAYQSTCHAFRAWTASPTNEFRRVALGNRNFFTGPDGVSCRWTALRDGVPFASGTFDLAGLAPQTVKAVPFPPHVRRLQRERGGLVALRVRFLCGETEIASDQFDLPFEPETLSRPSAIAEAEDSATRTFETRETVVVVAKPRDEPIAMRRKGLLWDDETLVCPPSLNGLGAVAKWSVLEDATVVLHAIAGDLEMNALGERERFALTLLLDGGDHEVRWLGRGPGPTSPNEKDHAFVGEYALSPTACRETREDVTGLRVGCLSVRTLARPFAFRVVPDETADRMKVEILAPPGGEFIDLTLSIGDTSLLPRAFVRDESIVDTKEEGSK